MRDTLHTWYRVEFYAAPPVGEIITDLDPGKVGRTLADAFGFVLVDGLTVMRCASDSGNPPAVLSLIREM